MWERKCWGCSLALRRLNRTPTLWMVKSGFLQLLPLPGDGVVVFSDAPAQQVSPSMLRLSPLNSQVIIAVFLETPWLISQDWFSWYWSLLAWKWVPWGALYGFSAKSPFRTDSLLAFLISSFHIFNHKTIFGILSTFTPPLCTKPCFDYFMDWMGKGGGCKKDNV